jgi:hypothetical protein
VEDRHLGQSLALVVRDAVAAVEANTGNKNRLRLLRTRRRTRRTQSDARQGRHDGLFYIESPAMRLAAAKKSGVGELRAHRPSTAPIIRPASYGTSMSNVERLKGKALGAPPSVDGRHPPGQTTVLMDVYQEDVTKTAMALAGFRRRRTADGLRRPSPKSAPKNTCPITRKGSFAGAIGARACRFPVVEEGWRNDRNRLRRLTASAKPHSASYALVFLPIGLPCAPIIPAEFLAAVDLQPAGGNFYAAWAYLRRRRETGA